MKNRSKVDAKKQRQFEDDFQFVMGHPSGRRILTWLIGECHLYQSSLSDNDQFSAAMEGERRIGLKIISQLERWPEQHIEFMKHNLSESRQEENQREVEKANAQNNEFD